MSLKIYLFCNKLFGGWASFLSTFFLPVYTFFWSNSSFFGCNDIPVCWFQNWFLSLLHAMCLPGVFFPQHFLLVFYLSLFRLVSVTPTTFPNPVLSFFCSVLALFLSTMLTILGFFQMLFAHSLFVSQLQSPRNSPLFGTESLDSSSFLL